MYQDSYIERRYRPSKNDLVCLFYIEPDGISFEKAANHVAGESSIGTWTEVSTMKSRIKKLAPKIFYLDKKNKLVKIAYPQELFENGNMAQIFSSIAGNVFGMKALKNLRLVDVKFPRDIMKSFKGPEFGIEGVRKILGVKKRPLVGTIIKPKVGLNPKEHSMVAYEAWLGGCDCVKDDENLTNQSFNQFNERIRLTLKMKERVERELGEKKVYMPNISAEALEMIKRGKFVKNNNGNYIMVDILTVGFSGLQTIRNAGLKLPIHGHRAMHAALTKSKKHGISMSVIAQAARLIGVDSLHIGAIFGKMEGEKKEVLTIEKEMEKDFVKGNKHVLEQRWHGMKKVFVVASGGLHPRLVPKVIKAMGKNIILQFGGGIHGHIGGTLMGARAARQAVDATMKNISLKEYAKKHHELMQALREWE